jgi:hypothetical protein
VRAFLPGSITSISCGSKEITSPTATEVSMLTQSTRGAVIGMARHCLMTICTEAQPIPLPRPHAADVDDVPPIRTVLS